MCFKLSDLIPIFFYSRSIVIILFWKNIDPKIIRSFDYDFPISIFAVPSRIWPSFLSIKSYNVSLYVWSYRGRANIYKFSIYGWSNKYYILQIKTSFVSNYSLSQKIPFIYSSLIIYWKIYSGTNNLGSVISNYTLKSY